MMKERRKEGGRKEVKEKEKQFQLKHRVPQCFFKEELASELSVVSSRNVALSKY